MYVRQFRKNLKKSRLKKKSQQTYCDNSGLKSGASIENTASINLHNASKTKDCPTTFKITILLGVEKLQFDRLFLESEHSNQIKNFKKCIK
jgi:hypothetical protein